MMRRNWILYPLALASLGGLTLLAACGDDDAASDDVTEVAVELSEFTISMPSTITGGPTRWTAKNTGTQEHHVTIGRLKDGNPADDVFAALAQPEGAEAAAMALVDLYGTPQSVAPGAEVTTLVDLPEGDYLALCFIPDPADGTPHFVKGMSTTFAVEGTNEGTALPADNTIRLTEFAFEVPDDLDWSKPVRVENVGQQPHEVAIYAIAEGKTYADVQAFMASQAPSGPPPFSPAGGVTTMSAGSQAGMELDLDPGSYVLLCFITDPASGAPHFVQGMMQEIVID
jgi:hypothetical protein